MMKVFAAQLFFCPVIFAAADEQPLVQCAVPVHVKFIVTPDKQHPEFKEPSAAGQKHWSAYECQMNIADQQDIDAVRQLQADVNASEYDDNETTTSTSTPAATTTTINVTNVTNATTTTTTTTSANISLLNETVSAELGGAHCWKTWSVSLLSLGLSLSLPVAEAAPGAFMARSQGRKLAELTEVVEVLLPCNALFDPLQDLDGDGAIDCKVTQEQNSIAEFVPEIDGTWQVLSSRSVSSATWNAEQRLSKDSITIGGGALCAAKEHLPVANLKERLPLALTNVVRFTHDGKLCSADKPCETAMWRFDLAYPSSSCTPEVLGWIQPCVAKLLPDGTLVLLRGAAVEIGADVRRPPLMAAVLDAAQALPFATGVSAATDLSLEVLLLSKYQSISSGSSNFAPGMANEDDADFVAEVRQLQSSVNASEEDNETSTDNETTTSTTTSAATVNTSTTTVNTSTTLVNLSELNQTVQAEIAQARDLRVWSAAFCCFALRLLVH